MPVQRIPNASKNNTNQSEFGTFPKHVWLKKTMSLNKLEELYPRFVVGSYNWGPYPWNNSAQRYERAILSTAPDKQLNCSMLSFWDMSRL